MHDSDCLLILGSILSDVDVLDPQRLTLAGGQVIHATSDRITIKHHRYDGIEFEVFVKGLLHLQITPFPSRMLPLLETAAYSPPEPADPITVQRLFSHLDTVLEGTTIVIIDVGESLFASADLHVRRRFEFLSPAYYTSMRFAVPAAVGTGLAIGALARGSDRSIGRHEAVAGRLAKQLTARRES